MSDTKNKFRLYERNPEKKIGEGYLAFNDGEALFFVNNKLAAKMIRAKLDVAAKDGILLSGFQSAGWSKNGSERFKYREWWLAYV